LPEREVKRKVEKKETKIKKKTGKKKVVEEQEPD
jgi:hypothetical protein